MREKRTFLWEISEVISSGAVLLRAVRFSSKEAQGRISSLTQKRAHTLVRPFNSSLKHHRCRFGGLDEEALHPVGAGVLFGQRDGDVLGFDAHVEVSAKALHA